MLKINENNSTDLAVTTRRRQIPERIQIFFDRINVESVELFNGFEDIAFFSVSFEGKKYSSLRVMRRRNSKRFLFIITEGKLNYVD